ncbi:MAG: hypothetical protein IJB53_03560 [Mailhella sp.]|nr:hypothetical protein [Mailhella sp.]
MSIFERVERFLWRRGFIHAPLRAATRNLLIFSGLFFLLGAALVPWRMEGFWAGVAALLSAWNFYTLALFIQQALPAVIPESDKKGMATARIVKKGLLLRTYLRLFLTGFFVYLALVQFQASPVALAAGLSASVTIIPLSLIFRR